MKAFVSIANFVLAAINVALFCLWFSMVKKDATVSAGEQATYVLNQVSVQVTILGAMVAFGALLLAGLGVFGFQAILERAAAQAERSAQSLIAQKFDDLVKRGSDITLRPRPGPLPNPNDAREVTDQ